MQSESLQIRAAAWCFAVVLLAVIPGCGEDEPAPERPQQYTVDTPLTRVEGVVGDMDGGLVADAEVTLIVGDQWLTTTTDQDGFFSFAIEPSPYRMTVTANGYQSFFWRYGTASGSSVDASVTIAAVERTGTFEASSGVTLRQDRASVVLPPHSFVDAGGNPLSGEVTYHLSFADPALAGDLSSSPWLEDIAVLGVINAEFSVAGEPVQLARGATAEIEVSLDGLPVPEDGAELSFFYYDEASFEWVEDGQVALVQTEDGQVVRGTVTHFTRWSAGTRHKITICHWPPGQTVTEDGINLNPQTLSIGVPALPSHVFHGDPMMACSEFFALIDACDPDTSLYACGDSLATQSCQEYAARILYVRQWLGDSRRFTYWVGGHEAMLELEADIPYCDTGHFSVDGTAPSGTVTADPGSGDPDGEVVCGENQFPFEGTCYEL